MRTIQRDIVGPFLFSSDGKMLLGKSYKGGVYKDLWIIPGGGVEEGETRMQALIRETIEETGIDITHEDIKEVDGELTGSSEKVLRDTGEHVLVEMTFQNYVVRLKEPADKVVLKIEDDFVEAEWFTTEQMKTMQLSPPTVTTLKKLGYL